jgi:hypothetical protein
MSTRLLVLLTALLFVVGFAALTIGAIAEQGLTGAGVISILILVLLGVGIIGAMRGPPQ